MIFFLVISHAVITLYTSLLTSAHILPTLLLVSCPSTPRHARATCAPQASCRGKGEAHPVSLGASWAPPPLQAFRVAFPPVGFYNYPEW